MCSLHDVRRHDRAWLEKILHPDFLEITRSGHLVGRSETIDALIAENSTNCIVSSNFRLTIVGEMYVILLYRTHNQDGGHAALRSSTWVFSNDHNWRLIFHQGTSCGL
ncbi:nuclear transport factor 2 family protein [Photorhabdus luminescens]|uniref:Nuclear transport factor 2 family protein n=1 Tax=Photorhabdus luminescens subsp. sonorensis TaxID=1173677 RepID=A0A5C4RL54_PHOLU|nr:nuclear transport factor 2 family protein [Photorhabdus luminescens]TNH44803.1 nuclear transport factor 2 family protein [Photorhabdus luminescens subsp. sonorensis]